MTEKIQERAIEAAAKFVDRRGYEVLDKAWSISARCASNELALSRLPSGGSHPPALQYAATVCLSLP